MHRSSNGPIPGVLCLFAGLALASPSWAAPLDEAQTLLAAGKAEDAAAVLTPAAEGGDAAAQARLGDLYRDGLGVRRNAITACRWYAAAAGRGVPAAQHEAGLCRIEGRDGEPPNIRAGAKLLEAAAEAGHAGALCAFGELLMRGSGVVQDVERGHALCLRAADAGDLRAQAALGELYLSGHMGVGRETEGAAWIGKAAARGDAASQYAMGEILWRGTGLAQDQMKAQSYFAAAAHQGHGPAQFWLGRHLIRLSQTMDGTVKPYEAAAAYFWLSLADAQPLPPPDQAQAAEWLSELRRGLDPAVVDMVDGKVAEWRPRKPEESIVGVASQGGK